MVNSQSFERWSKQRDAENARQRMVSQLEKIQKAFACGCVGPQNGEPVCPCAMRSVKIIDGRYVQTVDLGPISHSPQVEGEQT